MIHKADKKDLSLFDFIDEIACFINNNSLPLYRILITYVMKTRTKILIVIVIALLVALLAQDIDSLLNSFYEGYETGKQR